MNSPEIANEPTIPAERYDVVAVAASAGGVSALSRLLATLPTDLAVPVLIVQHLDRRRQTTLAQVLAHRSRLSVKLAEAGEQVKPGVAYIAPPDHHLLVTPGGVLTLTSTELVHFVRPSADLLFESVAGAYGKRAIACVLTGSGADGAMGVTAVKERGGTVIVQDPGTAEFDGMPRSAIGTGSVDVVLPLDRIGGEISRLVGMRRS